MERWQWICLCRTTLMEYDKKILHTNIICPYGHYKDDFKVSFFVRRSISSSYRLYVGSDIILSLEQEVYMKRRNRLFEQIQYRLRRSYGMDRLNTHLLILMIVILVLGLFVKNSIPALLVLVIFGIFVYRFTSRNITKRSIENRKYQDTNRFVTRQMKAIQNNVTNKEYKYFVCKHCYQLVRVPKGKGEIVIHCPHCKQEFSAKS